MPDRSIKHSSGSSRATTIEPHGSGFQRETSGWSNPTAGQGHAVGHVTIHRPGEIFDGVFIFCLQVGIIPLPRGVSIAAAAGWGRVPEPRTWYDGEKSANDDTSRTGVHHENSILGPRHAGRQPDPCRRGRAGGGPGRGATPRPPRKAVASLAFTADGKGFASTRAPCAAACGRMAAGSGCGRSSRAARASK